MGPWGDAGGSAGARGRREVPMPAPSMERAMERREFLIRSGNVSMGAIVGLGLSSCSEAPRDGALPLPARDRNVAAADGAGGQVQVDEALAQQYLKALRRMADQLALHDLPDSFDPMRAPGVISLGEQLPEPDDAWPAIEGAVGEALSALLEMRAAEGAHLREDMLAKLDSLQAHVSAIEERAPEVAVRYRENLHKRLAGAGLEIDLDDERVLREVGVFAERCDISEEITRLASHFVQCKNYLESGEPVGRSLDFLAQEMNRELNTIGSKANDATIAQRVVESKTELEKIREQVQNVE